MQQDKEKSTHPANLNMARAGNMMIKTVIKKQHASFYRPWQSPSKAFPVVFAKSSLQIFRCSSRPDRQEQSLLSTLKRGELLRMKLESQLDIALLSDTVEQEVRQLGTVRRLAVRKLVVDRTLLGHRLASDIHMPVVAAYHTHPVGIHHELYNKV
jgi:hypothetical protein